MSLLQKLSKAKIGQANQNNDKMQKLDNIKLGTDIKFKADQEPRLKRYFKDDELYLTEKELLRR